MVTDRVVPIRKVSLDVGVTDAPYLGKAVERGLVGASEFRLDHRIDGVLVDDQRRFVVVVIGEELRTRGIFLVGARLVGVAAVPKRREEYGFS